jgi:predicted DNA-binding antitoxin AbrB/MazE fold protein
MRECLFCKKELPVFKPLQSKYCSLKCGNKFRSRKHYSANPEKFKRKRIKESEEVDKKILSRVKNRAKTDGIPFNLELEDIIVPEYCPVLGIKLETIYGGGANQYGSPSLDRIYPEKGYVKGNVRVISNRANLLKSNATIEELECVLKNLKELYSDDIRI